ncbi:MAG: hypothetical protein J6W49_05505, partial [Paludibacteraceae bacterium]|nr:hypothetical protein [Paludibacteraceae bacterium]
CDNKDDDEPSAPSTPAVDNSKTVTIKDETEVTFVDLGLPSGTLWAERNVGAATPEANGDYYAWGETEPKTEYTEDNYTHATKEKDDNLSLLWGYEVFRYIYADLGEDISGTQHDAATANWGEGCAMPTKAQSEELANSKYTVWQKTLRNGKNGYLVKSKQNSNSIFIPMAGYIAGTDVALDGERGYNWTSTLFADPSSNSGATYLYFSEIDGSITTRYQRSYGLTVRPVSK